MRKGRLKKLRDWTLVNRGAIQEAMYADFRKHPTEVDAIELFPVLSEIRKALTNLDNWVSPKSVGTPLTMMGTRSYIQCEPRGVCLIIAPWNYPFLLCVVRWYPRWPPAHGYYKAVGTDAACFCHYTENGSRGLRANRRFLL